MGSLAWHMAEAFTLSGDDPIMATETGGWHNTVLMKTATMSAVPTGGGSHLHSPAVSHHFNAAFAKNLFSTS